MSPLDQAEHALGIASLVTIGVIAGSLYVAVLTIVRTVQPQWRRIWRLARGHVEQSASPIVSAAGRGPA